jgi:spore germination protein
MFDAVGYDLSEDKEKPFTVTVNFPSVTKQGEFQNKILSTDAKSSKDSRIRFNHMSNLKLVSGQISLALFGEDMAQVGVKDILDTFMRDPSLGPRVFFAVSEGNAKDLLLFQPKEGTNSSLYLRTFVEKLNAQNERVNYNSYQFIRDFYDDGIDPILPYFKIHNHNISIDGYAIFKDDKYIHHLPSHESAILFALRDDTKKGTLSIEMPKSDDKQGSFQDQLMFNYRKTKQKMDVHNKRNGPISVDIQIEMEGSVLEYSGEKNLNKAKVQKELEKEINEKLIKQSQNLINLTKELKVDPIGIGSHIRNSMSYEKWKKLSWEEVYPNVDVNVSIEMNFMDIGQSK